MRKIIKLISRIFKVLIIVATILMGIFIYITFIERNLLITKQYKLEINKGLNESVKVVQFADTHLGEYYSLENLEKAVKKINNQNPHIVVFTGDLIDNASTYDNIYEISKVLSKIDAKLGKYAIYGNRDYGGGAVRYFEDIMNDSGFKILKNSSEKIEYRGQTINLLGGDDGLLGNHNKDLTVNSISEEDINILLIHEPDLADEYISEPIDLVLSGHSHGGQVYIPFYGPIKKNTLSKKYNRGFYELDNSSQTKIYVNTGLGNTKVPFRFLTVPQVSVFEIN